MVVYKIMALGMAQAKVMAELKLEIGTAWVTEMGLEF
jgi:hypothetical protein